MREPRAQEMRQPYRSPGAIVEPPARVEALTLRRYPIWVQVFWLAWLPIAAVVVGQLVPGMTLACVRTATARPYCTLDEARLTGTRRYALQDGNAVWIREDAPGEKLAGDADAHLLVTGRLEGSEDEPERFSFEVSARDARRIKHDYDAFQTVTALDVFEAPLRRMGWLFGLFAAGELSLVALFAVLQRRIRIEVNANTGDVTVEDRRHLRRTQRRTVNLGAVKTLDLAFLGEEGDGHGRRVLASIRTSAEPLELFEAFEDEARRGFHLLERAHSRWTDEHPRP